MEFNRGLRYIDDRRGECFTGGQISWRVEADPTDRSFFERWCFANFSERADTLTIHPPVGNETELKKFDNEQPSCVDF